MEPDRFEASGFDSYGVQGADVMPAFGSNRYVVYAHDHTGNIGPNYLHYYEGQMVVDDDAVTSD